MKIYYYTRVSFTFTIKFPSKQPKKNPTKPKKNAHLELGLQPKKMERKSAKSSLKPCKHARNQMLG